MSREKKVKIFKLVIMVLVILILIGVTVYLFPVIKNLSTTEGQIEFKNRVNDTGFLGMLTLFGLQVAQIFLFILPGEPLEIFVDKDFIALKKYSPMTDFRTLAQILVDSVYDSISLNIFITDRDQCVAASNSIKKEYYNNPISSYLEKVLADRKKVSSPVKEVELSRNHTETISYTLNPIIVNGDVIGLVGLTSPTNITDSDEKIASFITEFLCKNIEE